MLEHYQRIVLKSIGLDFFAARSGAGSGSPGSTLGAGSSLAAVRAAARVVAFRELNSRGASRRRAALVAARGYARGKSLRSFSTGKLLPWDG